MIVLAAHNITKSFGVNVVLQNISLHLNEGEKIGLIGNNGSGKTTLMRILAGELSADSGSVQRPKSLSLGYLKQHAEFDEEKTLWETCLEPFAEVIRMGNRVRQLAERISHQAHEEEDYEKTLAEYQREMDEFEKRDGYQMESSIKGVLHGLGFASAQYDQKVGTFSGGQKSRVLLAVFLLAKPDILLMDEPTNHLDLEAVLWLESYLKNFTGTLLVISHDRYFLDAVTNRTAYLRDDLSTYSGNYTVFMQKHLQAMEIQSHAFENQQREIKRQEELIKRFENYGNKRYIIQARSRRRMLEKMDRVERPEDTSRQMKLKLNPTRESGKDVLDVMDLGMRFGDMQLFKGASFHVAKGERIGIIGPNGIGKTTLFRILREQYIASEGEFRFGTGVKIGYLDQEQSDLNPDNTIMEEIWDARPDLLSGEVRSVLATFLFYGDDIYKAVEDLSGGERARVALCKLMLSGCNTLLLDEPTNHLDIESKEALEAACTSYTGTLLFISHDRYFLNRVADRILVLDADGITSYLGNYDYYLEKSKPDEPIVQNVVNKTEEQRQKKRDRASRKLEKELQQERVDTERRIKESEEKLTALDQELADPAVYENRERLAILVQERQKLEEKLQSLYARWIELAEE